MPSGPHWANSLSRRIRYLERSLQPDQRAQWRAYLAQRFADSEYDDHREALIEALLSDTPYFHFTEGETAYMVSWWQRGTGAPVCERLYSALWLAI